MSELILITSVINTGNNPWSYCSSRSVYSPMERFLQTMQTIITIRKKIPNSKILLVECSDITDEMIEQINERVDYFINLYSDNFCKMACLETNKKGFGEAVQTLKAIEYIQQKNIEFHRFFKISGRYYLNDNFNLEEYSLFEYTFKKAVCSGPGQIAISTVFYSFPFAFLDTFKKNLESVLQYYLINEPKSYEELLPILCNPRKEIETIGVSGMVAVGQNDFFSS